MVVFSANNSDKLEFILSWKTRESIFRSFWPAVSFRKGSFPRILTSSMSMVFTGFCAFAGCMLTPQKSMNAKVRIPLAIREYEVLFIFLFRNILLHFPDSNFDFAANDKRRAGIV